jgi:creatinine amidohydrolase/Fe(II)-dependent formamide hydrolase-like protein
MLDMTLPEFRAAVAKTDIVILPIGSIEEHGPNLPLGTDSLLAVAQLVVALSEIAGDAGAPFAAVTSGLPTIRSESRFFACQNAVWAATELSGDQEVPVAI